MRYSYSNIYDLAHSFYYEEYADKDRYSASASWNGPVFDSYGTTIGLIAENKKGEKCLLSSYNNFSNTTAKHISALENASPLGKRLRVFFKYGTSLKHNWMYQTQEQRLQFIADNFQKEIAYEMDQKRTYTRKPEREHAQTVLSLAEDFAEFSGLKIEGLAKFRAYLKRRLDSAAIKKAMEKNRIAAATKAANAKKRAQAFREEIKNAPLLESIKKYIFDTSDFNKEDRKYKDMFRASFDVVAPSFVIIDGDEVKTSQHVREKIADVLPLLRMWKHKHNIIGLKLGQWTVLANNDKYVKIGCHNIPVANVQALADTLL